MCNFTLNWYNLVRIGQLSERDWQGVRACVKLAIAE